MEKKMRNRVLFIGVFVFGMAVASLAAGQSKQLVCKNKMTEEFLVNKPKFAAEMCAKYSNLPGPDHCKNYEQEKADATKCSLSGFSYTHVKTFTFDLEALKGGGENFAEEHTESCWDRLLV